MAIFKHILVLVLVSLLHLSQAFEDNCTFALNENGDPVYYGAGVSVAFSSEFFDNMLKGFLPELFDQIDRQIFENETATVNITDLMYVYLTADYFKITNLTYDLNKTYFGMNPEDNTLSFHIYNSSFNANLTYEIDTDPRILHDKGNLTFGFNEFSYDLNFSMAPSDESPKFVHIFVLQNEVDFEPKNLYVNINNTNNFNEQLVKIAKTIKNPIVNLIEKVVEENLESLVNDAVQLIPVPFRRGNYSIDMSLCQIPVVHDLYATNLFVGKIYPNDEDIPFTNDLPIPYYYESGQSMQIFITEYTLQSFIYTAYTLGNLALTVSKSPVESIFKFNTNSFDYFIPSIREKYGRDRPCNISFAAIEGYPRVNMEPGHILANGTFQLGIGVYIAEAEHWVTAVSFRVNTTFNGKISIDGELIAVGHIDDIQLYFVDIIEQNIDYINLDMLNKIFTIMELILQLAANARLRGGIDIAANLPFDFEIGVVKFDLLDQMMVLQATPNFKSEANKKHIRNMIQKMDFTRGLKGTDYKPLFKEAIKHAYKQSADREILFKKEMNGVKSVYKSYKFFERILNFQNENFEKQDFSDL